MAGLAVAVNTSQGETVGPPATVSQPAVPGPVLQPHQLSVAFCGTPVLSRLAPAPPGETLPVIRL